MHVWPTCPLQRRRATQDGERGSHTHERVFVFRVGSRSLAQAITRRAKVAAGLAIAAIAARALPFQIKCGPGRRDAPELGFSSCAQCEAGKFNRNEGAHWLRRLPRGVLLRRRRYGARAVPRGTFSNGTNLAAQTGCAACPAGSSCSADQRDQHRVRREPSPRRMANPSVSRVQAAPSTRATLPRAKRAWRDATAQQRER